MPEPDLIQLFARPLGEMGVRYLVSGSKQYSIGQTTISLAPPEYVILRKLQYYWEGRSEKHLRDIRSMLAISGEQIDRAVLNDWIQRRGLQPEWTSVSG